jgi:hypothetical protein
VFGWALERVEPKNQEEWIMSLDTPLPWEQETPTGRKQMWTEEDEAAAWAKATGMGA